MPNHFAPHTGAWIETLVGSFFEQNNKFAPHTGAWIETTVFNALSVVTTFAPHTGAWIETVLTVLVVAQVCSHPTRVRGLKPCYC